MKVIRGLILFIGTLLVIPYGVQAASDTVPVGTIQAFASATAPADYQKADGRAISRTDYKNLFAVIGTTYGSGNGSTTFNLPNLKGRIVVGMKSGDTDFGTLGKTGGQKTVALTVEQMPSHTHIQEPHTHTQQEHNHDQKPHNHNQKSHNHIQKSHGHTGTNSNGAWKYLVYKGTRSGEDVGDIPGSGWIMYQRKINVGYWSSSTYTPYVTSPSLDKINIAETATNNPTTAKNKPATAINQETTAENLPTGVGIAHNNLQPHFVMVFYIKAK